MREPHILLVTSSPRLSSAQLNVRMQAWARRHSAAMGGSPDAESRRRGSSVLRLPLCMFQLQNAAALKPNAAKEYYHGLAGILTMRKQAILSHYF